METINLRCTSCDHAMKFSPDKAGKKAKCPKCTAVFVIPTPEQAAALAPGHPPEGPAGAPPAPAAAAEEEYDFAAYNVLADPELEALRKKREEEDRLRLKELKKKKA